MQFRFPTRLERYRHNPQVQPSSPQQCQTAVHFEVGLLSPLHVAGTVGIVQIPLLHALPIPQHTAAPSHDAPSGMH
jgi:hypothetical protein